MSRGRRKGRQEWAKRRDARCLLPERLHQLEQTGAEVRILDANSSHIRILAFGRTLEFWGSTERWCSTGGSDFRVGFEKLVAHIGELAITPTPSRQLETRPPAAGPASTPSFDLTIITDASFDYRTRASGWGVWMKGAGGPSVQYGGAFRVQPRSPHEAEFFAIVNSLHVAVSKGFMNQPGWNVLVQSDCQLALGMVRSVIPGTPDRPAQGGARVSVARPRHLEQIGDAVGRLRDVVQLTGCVLAVRHVKGHTTNQEGRFWVNRTVDGIARQAMREQRAHRTKGAKA